MNNMNNMTFVQQQQQGRANMVQHQQQQQQRQGVMPNQQQLHSMGSPCPSSPQVMGPAQSPRGPGMMQSSPSPMGVAPTTPQPSPSPVQRVVVSQQQRPMPAPSPMMQQHHSPMTPGTAGVQQLCSSAASPMPSPSPAGHHSVLSSISSPRGMGQHGQVGTPLSQHSAEGETGGLNSPFSPGPMASPQPVMPGGPHSAGMVRLTSPQTHPPRLPSPQQQQHVQAQQQMGMAGPGPQQQQQNMGVRMIRPQMGPQHPHMVPC